MTLPDFNEIKPILFWKRGIEVEENDNFFELPICSKEKYYVVRTSNGYLLNIIHFTVKNTQIQSKCPSSCLWSSDYTECNGHQIKHFIEWVKNYVKKIGENEKTVEEIVAFNYVHCVRKFDHVNIYFIYNPTHHGTDHADVSMEFLKFFLFKTLKILHNSDFQHKYKDINLMNHSNFICTLLFIRDVSNNFISSENDVMTTFANLIEMFWYTYRKADKMPDDMEDFVDKCKSDTKLLPSELLKHAFFQGEKKIINNDIKSRLNIDFEIHQELGRGAFGKVIKARHLLDNQLYAIKRVPIKSEKEFNEKTKEIDLTARLTHEHVVRYYNSWIEEATEDDFDASSSDVTGSEETDQSINQINNAFKSGSLLNKVMCIQMEFCGKSTLRLAIDNDLSIDGKRRLLLFKGIRDGLSYIHSQNIIHRDLNPRNIFINSNDQVKIGDFGQATTPFLALKSKFTNKTDPSIVGTLLYVAPELMENSFSKTYDKFVDLYSLGIIYFEMCNPPFKTEMERYEKIKALRDDKLKLPISGDSCLIKALVKKDVNERIQSYKYLPLYIKMSEMQELPNVYMYFFFHHLLGKGIMYLFIWKMYILICVMFVIFLRISVGMLKIFYVLRIKVGRVWSNPNRNIFRR